MDEEEEDLDGWEPDEEEGEVDGWGLDDEEGELGVVGMELGGRIFKLVGKKKPVDYINE